MHWLAKCLLVIVGLAMLSPMAQAKPRVSLELRTRPGLPLTASQQWYKVLTDLGISGLQISAAGPRDEMGITAQGGKESRQYNVVGILAADNVLHLPGGKFSPTDTGRLRKWLDTLTDLGPEGVTQSRAEFGLLPRALEQVRDDLKQPVRFSTRDMPVAKAVARVSEPLAYSLVLSDADKRALASITLEDEFQGLASGTSLAAMLRSAGLALLPERPQGGELHYQVGPAQPGNEGWPVGRSPSGKVNETFPELFEFLNVEIQDIPVSEALEAIAGRLKVPFVYDRNAMTLHGIDPSKSQADVPSKRMTYSLILKRVLSQAKMKFDPRIDDADKPFLWITTVKPVK